MQSAYLDNASTTMMHPGVIEAMLPYMCEYFGNPSSLHRYGRKAKVAIENSRSDISKLVGAAPAEIFFTSGGTEGNNIILRSAINSLGITDVISSPLEHASVFVTLNVLEAQKKIKLHFIDIDSAGQICYDSLEKLLKRLKKPLLSLMHANNEIGNLIDLHLVGGLCRKYGALFHTDSVQTIGKYNIELSSLPVDFAVASAHKFHGPKGIGFIYVKSGVQIEPYFTGGAQERNMRAGTESVASIVGMGKALSMSLTSLNVDKDYIIRLKSSMIDRLRVNESFFFNGSSSNIEKSLYTILNVGIRIEDRENMLLFSLDAAGVCVSAGSACSSGSSKVSRVISTLHNGLPTTALRFSFSKYNSIDDISHACEKLILFSERL
jgi:cysteine desulfurase